MLRCISEKGDFGGNQAKREASSNVAVDIEKPVTNELSSMPSQTSMALLETAKKNSSIQHVCAAPISKVHLQTRSLFLRPLNQVIDVNGISLIDPKPKRRSIVNAGSAIACHKD